MLLQRANHFDFIKLNDWSLGVFLEHSNGQSSVEYRLVDTTESPLFLGLLSCWEAPGSAADQISVPGEAGFL